MRFVFRGDEALLKGCLCDKKGAWDEFVRRFSKLIYWSVRRAIKNAGFEGREDLVGDLFQDIFQKIFDTNALNRLSDYQGIRKYLVVLSTRVALDRLRSISRLDEKSVYIDAGVPEDLEAGSFSGGFGRTSDDEVDSQAVRNEKQAVISEVLAELGARERACIEFYIFDSKTHSEISLILGLPQDTVSSIIRRAKDKIRENILKKGLFE